MAKILHLPPRCDSDDPEALYASALARAGHNPKLKKAIEDAYIAGYMTACQEAEQLSREIISYLQNMNALLHEQLRQVQAEMNIITGKA